MIDSSENNKNTRMIKQAFLFWSAIRLYAVFTAMYVNIFLFLLIVFYHHLLLIFVIDKVDVVEVDVRS